jgi:hypothetical protein
MQGELFRSSFWLCKTSAPEPLTSELLNEETFYTVLTKDLKNCHSELLIESPFITNRRLNQLMPAILETKGRKVRVVINTRDPQNAISRLQHSGVHRLFIGGHHRKLVVIDRKVH